MFNFQLPYTCAQRQSLSTCTQRCPPFGFSLPSLSRWTQRRPAELESPSLSRFSSPSLSTWTHRRPAELESPSLSNWHRHEPRIFKLLPGHCHIWRLCYCLCPCHPNSITLYRTGFRVFWATSSPMVLYEHSYVDLVQDCVFWSME